MALWRITTTRFWRTDPQTAGRTRPRFRQPRPRRRDRPWSHPCRRCHVIGFDFGGDDCQGEGDSIRSIAFREGDAEALPISRCVQLRGGCHELRSAPSRVRTRPWPKRIECCGRRPRHALTPWAPPLVSASGWLSRRYVSSGIPTAAPPRVRRSSGLVHHADLLRATLVLRYSDVHALALTLRLPAADAAFGPWRRSHVRGSARADAGRARVDSRGCSVGVSSATGTVPMPGVGRVPQILKARICIFSPRIRILGRRPRL